MQSNNTEREEILEDLVRYLNLVRDTEFFGEYASQRNPDYGSDEPSFIPKYHKDEMDTFVDFILAREHRKTLEARIDELVETYNENFIHWGDDLERAKTQIRIRIAELQSQLPKKEAPTYNVAGNSEILGEV